MNRKGADSSIIAYRVTTKQKLFLESLAHQSGKTISEFCRNAALTSTNSTFQLAQQTAFNDTVKHYMIEQQKMMYIIARLVVYIGGEVTREDQIMEFFNVCKSDAEKLYGNGSGN